MLNLPVALLLLLPLGFGPGSDPAAQSSTAAAVDSIFDALAERPLVALTEPHGNEEFHDLLRTLLRDPRFLARVDDVVVEFACASQQDVLDRYVAGHAVSVEELSRAWRDTAVSPQVTWDAPVYGRFFETVREVNADAARAGSERRLRVLAGDPPIDWGAIRERHQLMALYNTPELERDVHFARVVEQEVLARGRRALLISGSGHLTRRNLWVPPAPNPSPDTVTVHLLRRHPDSVHVIHTLSARLLDHDALVARLAPLPAPAVLPLDAHWLGEWPASDFAGVRRYNVTGPGRWPFEGLAFAEVADAALYLGTTFTDSLPALDHASAAYRAELNRRRRILGAPERTRVDDGLLHVQDLIDGGRLDEAVQAIETIKGWDPGSDELDQRLMELHARIEASAAGEGS